MKIPYWRMLINACGNLPAYQQLKDTPLKRMVVYILLLLVIFGIVPFFSMIFLPGYENWSIPDMTIQNGVLSSTVDQPYTINDEPEFTVILDTTGTVEDLDEGKIGMIIGESSVIVKRRAYETREYDFSAVEEFTITKSSLKNILRVLIIVGLLIGLLAYGVFLVGYFFFISLFGMLFQKMFKTHLRYQQLWVVCVFAYTPVIILGILLNLVGVIFMFRNTLLYLVFLGVIIRSLPYQ
jgi:hypothetical protein